MDKNIQSPGRPQWFKMWVEKYSIALDIDNIDKEFGDDPDGEKVFFEEVGKCFINALRLFGDFDKKYWNYEPQTRDGRVLWNYIKQDVTQSFLDYEKRVNDGKKGGRPRTKTGK